VLAGRALRELHWLKYRTHGNWEFRCIIGTWHFSGVQATVLQEEPDDREDIYLPSPFFALLKPALTYGYPFNN
jgi:hypothetical protein